jgi:uncharacterized protein (TIGR03437 family)
MNRPPIGRHAGPALAALAVFGCAANVFAQSPSAQAASSSGPGRPLLLSQTRYRLRAGERVPIVAAQETLDFLRNAKTRAVSFGGAQKRGIVVGPNVGRDSVLLAASLTMKPGEYAVTVSAVGKTGEVRAAAVVVTLDPMQPVPSTSTVPPVVLLNGWQFPTTLTEFLTSGTCPVSVASGTFGSLETQLMTSQSVLAGNPKYPAIEGAGVPIVYFFDNCVEDPNGQIENLGNVLGDVISLIRFDNGAPVPQVDLVSHSMGGLIVRSYLSGLQTSGVLLPPLNPRVRKFIEIATPNFGSFFAWNWSYLIPIGTQAREMIPGSPFLWNLGTWNQRGDDLRGVDGLAIIGDAGYWQASNLSGRSSNLSDGVVSITSASLGFVSLSYARSPLRTRILNYCHIDSSAGGFIDCTGSGIADAPETAAIVLSFLENTSLWESIGNSNQTQYGGLYFALENAAGTQYTALENASLVGSASLQVGESASFFYGEFINYGTGTLTATSSAGQGTTCGSVSVQGGYYSPVRCKFNPSIFSVQPSTSAGLPGLTIAAGSTITISGVGFSSSTGTALTADGIALSGQVISDQEISAVLPSNYLGLITLVVSNSNGQDAINIVAASPTLPPTISIPTTQANFAYTSGGVVPPPQTISISNSGGGSLSWSASSNASWLSVTASGTAPSTLAISANPSGLNIGSYNGAITLTAAGAANSPQTIAVALTITAASPTMAVTSVTNAASSSPGAIAPGEIIAIKGSGLGPATGVSFSVDPNTGMVDTSLAGTVVRIGGIPAPILYTSTGQVNAIAPYEIAGQSQVVMQVQYQGVSSAGSSTLLQVASAAPGLFTFNSTGTGPAAAVNQDGSFNGSSNPAADGSYVTLYFTGGGLTNPAGVTGSVSGSVLKWLAQTVTVTVGGQPAIVAFDGAAPTFIDGFLQLNIGLPSGVHGTVPVVVSVGGIPTPATATLAVQ